MSIFDTIKTDIGDAVKWAEDEAAAVWGYFKSAVTTFLGSELTQMESLVATVIADVEKGDIAALETAFANELGRLVSDGEAAAVALFDKLKAAETGAVQGILALIAAKVGWPATTAH